MIFTDYIGMHVTKNNAQSSHDSIISVVTVANVQTLARVIIMGSYYAIVTRLCIFLLHA